MAEHAYGRVRRGRCDCVEGKCAGSGRRDGMARTVPPPRIRSSTTCKVAEVVALEGRAGEEGGVSRSCAFLVSVCFVSLFVVAMVCTMDAPSLHSSSPRACPSRSASARTLRPGVRQGRHAAGCRDTSVQKLGLRRQVSSHLALCTHTHTHVHTESK